MSIGARRAEEILVVFRDGGSIQATEQIFRRVHDLNLRGLTAGGGKDGSRQRARIGDNRRAIGGKGSGFAVGGGGTIVRRVEEIAVQVMHIAAYPQGASAAGSHVNAAVGGDIAFDLGVAAGGEFQIALRKHVVLENGGGGVAHAPADLYADLSVKGTGRAGLDHDAGHEVAEFTRLGGIGDGAPDHIFIRARCGRVDHGDTDGATHDPVVFLQVIGVESIRILIKFGIGSSLSGGSIRVVACVNSAAQGGEFVRNVVRINDLAGDQKLLVFVKQDFHFALGQRARAGANVVSLAEFVGAEAQC